MAGMLFPKDGFSRCSRLGSGEIDMQRETRHTVLVIEADSTLRRLIALGLQYRGMQVVEASSPSALSSLEGQQFDLVVLDVDGEAGSSPSLLDEVQALPCLPTCPAAVLARES